MENYVFWFCFAFKMRLEEEGDPHLLVTYPNNYFTCTVGLCVCGGGGGITKLSQSRSNWKEKTIPMIPFFAPQYHNIMQSF